MCAAGQSPTYSASLSGAHPLSTCAHAHPAPSPTVFNSIEEGYYYIHHRACHFLQDIFAINQHPYVEEKGLLQDDVANLGRVIRAVDSTLFCLDDAGVVLSRIWYTGTHLLSTAWWCVAWLCALLCALQQRAACSPSLGRCVCHTCSPHLAHRCLYEIWQTVLAKGAPGLLILVNQVGVRKIREIWNLVDVSKAQVSSSHWSYGASFTVYICMYMYVYVFMYICICMQQPGSQQFSL